MAQNMSDSQVLEYVKEGIRQGKEQKQLASELARKGVTKEQAMRVKQLYEQQNNVNASNATGTDVNESRLREEMKENTSDMLEDHPSTQDLARGNQVFGRNIFNTRNLTFEPSVNIATPLNYRLGPGDEVIIDIWGASQNTIRQQISPDGTINIQKIGPVNLNGLTIAEANDYLKKTLNKIYNGLNNANDPTSDIRLTLGSIRTIQINVMGEVVQPGTYSLSSFATVFHALYRAGGVSDIGSLLGVHAGVSRVSAGIYSQDTLGNEVALTKDEINVVVPFKKMGNNVTNLNVGDQIQLTTTAKPSEVTWSTTSNSVLQVDATTGLVTAMGAGKATIIATRTQDELYTVYGLPYQLKYDFVVIDGFGLSTTSATVNIGDSFDLTALVTDEDLKISRVPMV